MLDNKKFVQLNFDSAANSYFKHALVQKISAKEIIHSLFKHNIHSTDFILDLGSGSGTFLHLDQSELINYELNGQIILYDLSHKMLKLSSNVIQINGDATYLPFINNGISYVISNFMIQWSNNKVDILNEVYRVMKPDGKFILSALIKPSLWQLYDAWQLTGNSFHMLDFLLHGDYINLIDKAGFKLLTQNVQESTLYFANIKDLITHFKLTGTSMNKYYRLNGLSGRKIMAQLETAYLRYQTNQGLPLTYSCLVIMCEKKSQYAESN